MAETSARDDENNGLNSDDNRNLAPAVGVLANELTDDRRAAYVEPFIAGKADFSFNTVTT